MAATTRHRPVDEDVLHLGCGTDYRDGCHNVDVNPAVGADEHHDLEDRPWPWPDNAFSVVIARHVLEHLATVPWDELVRVLRPGGTLKLSYPIGHTRFEDPTHKQHWNYQTAAALAGERNHPHEHVDGLRLDHRQVTVEVSGRLCRWYTRLRLWKGGPGSWLSQVPGLHGEVTATYTTAGES